MKPISQQLELVSLISQLSGLLIISSGFRRESKRGRLVLEESRSGVTWV